MPTQQPATTQQPINIPFVHYVMPTTGKHRPAIIVEDWGATRPDGLVNLLVFRDGSNDGDINRLVVWETSIHHDQDTKAHGTWHYPEGTEAAIEHQVTLMEALAASVHEKEQLAVTEPQYQPRITFTTPDTWQPTRH